MKNIAKKKIRNFLHISFVKIKKNGIYKKLKKLKLVIRIIISIFCGLWFIIAFFLIPPLPLSTLALMLGLVILFPIGKVKSKLKYFIHKLRINKLYAKRLGLNYRIKNRYKK